LPRSDSQPAARQAQCHAEGRWPSG
jgi:hypothetical protein